MTRLAVFVFALFLSGAMNVLNAQVEVPKEVQGDEDYINWSTMPIENGFNGFQVHPSGNIIAYKGNEFFEISGETGLVLRAFEVQYGYNIFRNLSISPDGKYFAYCVSQQGGSGKRTTFIVKYEDGKVISKKESQGDLISFLGDSKHYGLLILDFETHTTIGINIYNIAGDSVNSIKGSFSDFVFSPDGKYLLTIRVVNANKPEEISYVDLWDAQNFKFIKNLHFSKNSHFIRSFQFSKDGKYAGFNSNGSFIYKIPDFTIIKKYEVNNGYVFLYNDYIAISGTLNTSLYRITDDSDSQIFYHEGHGGGGIDFNQKLNSIIVRLPELTSLNLDKILSKVGVEDNKDTPIQVQYKDKLLIISNLILKNNGKLAKIIDMQGNIVFQFPIQSSQDGSFSIPIPLPNGAYILNIDEQAYKFLVVE